MSKTDDLIKKGLIQEKKEALRNTEVILNSHWESFYVTYVPNKMHPEKHDTKDLRLLASNLCTAIDDYKLINKELDELEGKI